MAVILYWALSWLLQVSGNMCEAESAKTVVIYTQNYALEQFSGQNLCQTVSNLSSALSLSATSLNSTIFLTSEFGPYPFETSQIVSQTAIHGQGATIALSVKVTIVANATLLLTDIGIRQNGEVAGWTVQGAMTVTQCRFDAWQSTIFYVVSGGIDIVTSRFEGNSGTVMEVKSWGIAERVNDSEFIGNSGKLILCGATAGGNMNLLIGNSTFIGNVASVFIEIDGQSGVFSIKSSKFHQNIGLISDFVLSNGLFEVSNSEFTENLSGGFQISLNSGEISVTATAWKSNSFPFLLISHLSGSLFLSNSTFSLQHSSAPIQIMNSGELSKCFAFITNSTFSDYTFSPAFATAGAIYSVQCSVFVNHTYVRNVISLSHVLTEAYGVIYALMSFVSIDNTIMERAGGSGADVTFLLSGGVIRNSEFVDAVVGASGVVIIAGSNATLESISFRGGRLSPLLIIENNIIFYIISEMSTIFVSNLTIHDNTIVVEAIITAFYSKVDCEYVYLRNISGYTGFLRRSTDMNLTYTGCDMCDFRYFSEGSGVSLTNIGHAKFVNSRFTSGIFVSGSGGNQFISNIDIDNVTMSYFVSGDFSNFTISDLRISGSDIGILLRDFLRSDAILKNIVYRNSKGALIGGSLSKIDIFDSDFDSLSALLNIQSSEMTIVNTTFRYLTGEQIATISSTSVFSLISVVIFHAISISDAVFLISDSQLIIASSTFHDFNASLFSCKRTEISVIDSVFERGGFAKLTVSGPQHLSGGLIYCLDCRFVTLKSIKVNDVAADMGGAVYVESVENDGFITIENSEFENCRANNGGAGMVVGLFFTISLSNFINCTASATGGALSLSIRDNYPRTIQHSKFINNTAYEGGAIKWISAPPTLSNLIFSHNSAFYGANVASFGVNLSSNVHNQLFAPGQLVYLSFDLLDHYGEKIVTANTQFLQLISTESLTFQGVNDKAAISGTFNFSMIELLAHPNSNQTLTIEYRWGDVRSNFTFEIAFRDCLVGELKSLNSCTPCQNGYFSLDITDERCSLCPSIASCSGGNSILPRKDAWLTTISSNPIVACQVKDTCLGGANNTCAPGHEGMLCAQCTTSHFPLLFTSCWECPPVGAIIAEMVAVFIVFVLTLHAIVSFSVLKPNPAKLFVLKTVISHVQGLSLLAYMRVSYPPALQVFYRIMLDLSSIFTATFPFVCFGYEYYYNVGLAVVSGVISLILAGVLIAGRCLRFRTLRLFRSEFPIIAVAICWYLPVSVALSVLPMFSCLKIAGDSRQFLIVDVSQECWSGVHSQIIEYVVVPAFVVNVGIPFVILCICVNSKVVRCFSSEFRSAFLEILFILRKFLGVIAVVMQMNYSSTSQIYSEMIILYLVITIESLFSFYKDSKDMVLTQASNFLLLLTYSGTIMFFEYLTYTGSIVLTCAVLIANIAFFTFCGYKLCRDTHRNLRVYEVAQASCQILHVSDLLVPNNSGSHMSVVNLQFE